MFENPDTLLRDLIKDVVTENPTAWAVVQQTMVD